jgi:hypothetical protein
MKSRSLSRASLWRSLKRSCSYFIPCTFVSQYIHAADSHFRHGSDLTTYINVAPQIWLASIAAASRWDAPTLRSLAISNLEKAGSVARLAAARKHGEERWLLPSIIELCRRPHYLTAAEFGLLDPKDAAYIASIRESAYSERYGLLGDMVKYVDAAMAETPPS